MSRVIELSRGASRAFVEGRDVNTCNRVFFFNLAAIELKLYRPFRAGEAHILTKFDYSPSDHYVWSYRTVPGS